MCNYWDETSTQYYCDEPAQQGLDYCIFHDPSPNKNARKFSNKLTQQLRGKGNNERYSFVGYKFPDGWTDTFKKVINGKFDEPVNFIGAKFCEEADFFHITFGDMAIFTKSEFDKFAKFSHATFNRHAIFSQAEFRGGASFSHTNFECVQEDDKTVDFQEAYFSYLHFDNAELPPRDANFTNLRGSGNAFFQESTFGSVDFTKSLFKGEITDFSDTIFKREANFSEVRFYGQQVLFHTNLENVSFLETSLKNVDFSRSKWLQYREVWSRAVCKDDLNAERREEYKKASHVCREIKQAYKNTGNYREAGEFYYGEMECRKRSIPDKQIHKKALYFFFKVISGYGESVSRVILSSLTTVLLWSGLFYWQGFQLLNSTRSLDSLTLLKRFGASMDMPRKSCTSLLANFD